jgi:signal transduction histidine kinase
MEEVEPSAWVGATQNTSLLGRLAEASRSDTSNETQSLRLTLLDVNDVLRRLAPRLRRVLRKQRSLVLSLAPNVGLIVADARQLEQTVIAMALDARRAMPTDGALWIATTIVGEASPGADRSTDWCTPPRGLVCMHACHSGGETVATVYLPRVL